ncbi:ribonuclease H-like domain-containing protein [Tanacetum coccineum]
MCIKPIFHLSFDYPLTPFPVSPIPKNPFDALKDPKWRNAINDEYNALVKNGTWLLARLVSNGSSQQLGVDFDETFSPVVKPATIRMILSLDVSCQCGFQVMPHELDFITVAAILLCLYVDRVLRGSTLFSFFVDAQMVMANPSGHPLIRICLLDVAAGLLLCMISRDPNFAALKRILRYVRGTVDFGLQLYAFATTSLVGYTNADWAGYPSSRSAKAEYRGVANIVVRVLHVPSRYQYADIFTKGLPSALFEEFRSSLSIHPSPAPTTGAY